MADKLTVTKIIAKKCKSKSVHTYTGVFTKFNNDKYVYDEDMPQQRDTGGMSGLSVRYRLVEYLLITIW